MKKKSSAFILSLGLLALCSCSLSDPLGPSSSEEPVSETYAIYQLYAKNVSEKGEAPLSYEDWLASIKGEKGDVGPQGPQGPQGVGIAEIVKTKTEGDVDTYEIRLTDGSSYPFTVTNDSRSKTIVDTYLQNGHLIVVYSDGSSDDTGSLLDVDVREDAYAYYPLDDGTYGIGVGNNTQLSSLTLPSTHNGKPITWVVKNGFGAASAKQITVPSGITHIGEMAFGNANFERLILSDTVTYLHGAFLSGGMAHYQYEDTGPEGDYVGTADNPPIA